MYVTKSKPLIIFAILFLLAGAALSSYSFINQKSYHVDNLTVNAQIQSNGGMYVEESRTITYKNGPFTRSFIDIPKTGFREINDIKIYEADKEYKLVKSEAEAEDRPEGYYYIIEDDDKYHIEWYINETDGTRSFTVKYNVKDCIQVYKDTAQLYWKFVGEENNQMVDKCSVSVYLPNEVDKETLKVWGHGPISGDVTIISAKEVKWEADKLPAFTMLEARMLFPASLIPNGGIRSDSEIYDKVLAEEQEWTKQAENQKLKAKLKALSGIFIVITSFIICIFVYLKRGRKFKPDIELEYQREIPGDYSPAELCVLYSFNSPKDTAISSTILDLARRKYIQIEVIKGDKKDDVILNLINDNYIDLMEHEKRLIEFLFNKVGEAGRVAISSIKESKEKSLGLKGFIDSWFQCIREEGKARSFFDEASMKATNILMIAFVILLIITIGLFIASSFYIGISTAIAAIIFLIFSINTQHRSLYGEEQFMRWKAFKKFLIDFSNLDRAELPQLVLWEHYLVYAVALGVAKQVLKQLPIAYPELGNAAYMNSMLWFGMHHYNNDGMYGTASFESLTNVMANVENSFQNVLSDINSTSGGGGGGFSSGGGGGGGGSSFGAD